MEWPRRLRAAQFHKGPRRRVPTGRRTNRPRRTVKHFSEFQMTINCTAMTLANPNAKLKLAIPPVSYFLYEVASCPYSVFACQLWYVSFRSTINLRLQSGCIGRLHVNSGPPVQSSDFGKLSRAKCNPRHCLNELLVLVLELFLRLSGTDWTSPGLKKTANHLQSAVVCCIVMISSMLRLMLLCIRPCLG